MSVYFATYYLKYNIDIRVGVSIYNCTTNYNYVAVSVYNKLQCITASWCQYIIASTLYHLRIL